MEPRPEAVCLPLPNHRTGRRADGEALLGEEGSLPLPHAIHWGLQDPPLGGAVVHGDPDSPISGFNGRASLLGGRTAVPHSWK